MLRCCVVWPRDLVQVCARCCGLPHYTPAKYITPLSIRMRRVFTTIIMRCCVLHACLIRWLSNLFIVGSFTLLLLSMLARSQHVRCCVFGVSAYLFPGGLIIQNPGSVFHNVSMIVRWLRLLSFDALVSRVMRRFSFDIFERLV